ncbi:hypothetical protein XSP_001040 [Xanthomonas euroxanthea]|uniref:Uncharacterized protein n=1 Tax=Xanthomonas euroxanthea TaxID=2259622 RepID=A0A8E4DUE0_9XANT|nr:hypothetical protein [Xanthomonas euroxanthea]CAD1788727.1 hypothetical protein XSP_001040 [Xanthomonas euroxanthea]SYZ52241.1 hypothetical protein CPBF367_10450 [Xanthomonas arboricola pv. juglandis]
MSRTYQRTLAAGWAVVAILAAVCIPLRLAEIHSAHRSGGTHRTYADEQRPALPHVRLARAQD